jgi:hypothetical protein
VRGSNNDAQPGIGVGADSSTPVQVVGLAGATLVSAGGGHSYVRVGQDMKCWGFNQAGQVGGGEGVLGVLVPRTVGFP